MLKVFLSYPFRQEYVDYVTSLTLFLEQQEVEVVDGRQLAASETISEQIMSRIDDCDVLICLLVEDVDSRWVDHEIGYALGQGLEIITIIDGEIKLSGITSAQYHIHRSKGDMVVSAELAKTLKVIRKKLGAVSDISISANAPIEEILSEGWSSDVMAGIMALREGCFSQANFEAALPLCDRYIREFPECWRFMIAKSSALIHLKRYDEADQVLSSIKDQFQSSNRALSYAFDNAGWLTRQRTTTVDHDSLSKELSLYEAALRHEERFTTYVNEIQCLLALERIGDAEREFVRCLKRFPKAVVALQEQVRIQGSDFVRNLTKSELLSTLMFPREEN